MVVGGMVARQAARARDEIEIFAVATIKEPFGGHVGESICFYFCNDKVERFVISGLNIYVATRLEAF